MTKHDVSYCVLRCWSRCVSRSEPSSDLDRYRQTSQRFGAVRVSEIWGSWGLRGLGQLGSQ
eukprot:2948687-Pleurochrysis_carterae.AAC.1